MLTIIDAQEIVSEEMLKVFKQRRKRFLSNLTKAINRAKVSLEQNSEVNEIAVLKENVEFTIYKLQKNLEDICLHALVEEVVKPNSSSTKSERTHSAILRCEQLMSRFDDDIQSQATTYTFEMLLEANQVKSSKGSKTSSASSKHSSSSLRSESEKI